MRWLFNWLGLDDSNGRRAWAFLAMLLGCGLMTAFAAFALYIVRGDATYSFWLGLAAHAQILVALSGFTAMFVKRDYDIETKIGSVKIKDKGNVEFSDEQVGGSRRVRVSASSSGGTADSDADEELNDRGPERDHPGAEGDDRNSAR